MLSLQRPPKPPAETQTRNKDGKLSDLLGSLPWTWVQFRNGMCDGSTCRQTHASGANSPSLLTEVTVLLHPGLWHFYSQVMETL